MIECQVTTSFEKPSLLFTLSLCKSKQNWVGSVEVAGSCSHPPPLAPIAHDVRNGVSLLQCVDIRQLQDIFSF